MTELITSGIELMVAGMGIVYLFLAMLVVAIGGMSSLVQRFFPEPPAPTQAVPHIATQGDKDVIAAITAAVHQHRNSNRL